MTASPSRDAHKKHAAYIPERPEAPLAVTTTLGLAVPVVLTVVGVVLMLVVAEPLGYPVDMLVIAEAGMVELLGSKAGE